MCHQIRARHLYMYIYIYIYIYIYVYMNMITNGEDDSWRTRNFKDCISQGNHLLHVRGKI
jgi:hypothetical protein